MQINVDVTIGWTMSDRANGYSSFDGYRPGARQHTETINVEWTNAPEVADDDMLAAIGATRADAEALRIQRVVEALAEACFEATNAPFATGLAAQIAEKIAATGYRGEQAGHYSLSVGDTVTVNEVTLACARFGWERVTMAPVGA